MKVKGISNKGMERIATYDRIAQEETDRLNQLAQEEIDRLNQFFNPERDTNGVLEAQAVAMDYIVDALYTLREADYDLFSEFGAAKFQAAVNALSELSDNPEKIFTELW